MKNFFKNKDGDKTILWAFLGSVFFVFIDLIYVLLSLPKLPPFVPLFNQMPWGLARLGTKEQIFIPISVALFISVVNFVLSIKTYEKSPLLSRILSITSFAIAFLTLLFTLRTIQIII